MRANWPRPTPKPNAPIIVPVYKIYVCVPMCVRMFTRPPPTRQPAFDAPNTQPAAPP